MKKKKLSECEKGYRRWLASRPEKQKGDPFEQWWNSNYHWLHLGQPINKKRDKEIWDAAIKHAKEQMQ